MYLKEYQAVSDAERELNAYFQCYNQERLHQALEYQTPVQVSYRAPFRTSKATETCLT